MFSPLFRIVYKSLKVSPQDWRFEFIGKADVYEAKNKELQIFFKLEDGFWTIPFWYRYVRDQTGRKLFNMFESWFLYHRMRRICKARNYVSWRKRRKNWYIEVMKHVMHLEK